MNNKEVLKIEIKAILPTVNGCALFLGNDEKVFVIYMDSLVGNAIGQIVQGAQNERPLTHDLMSTFLTALGARVERVIINDLKGSTYYGRMIITAENELQQRKVIELDARPSDCLALALRQKAPIYISRQVWDEVEVLTEVFNNIGREKSGDAKEGREHDT